MRPISEDAIVDRWIDALVARHTQPFSSSEFLKAARALSARYVEQRQQLNSRRPTDSAGKRAAFAALFAPLHFFTARAVVHELGLVARDMGTIIDLGCGTGVVGAAWASTAASRPTVWGLDRDEWALGEAQWNWRTLGVDGRTRRVDLTRPLAPALAALRLAPGRRHAIVLGWSANELPPDRVASLLPELLAAHGPHTSILVLEPLARSVTPWWPTWAAAFLARGGRADEWKFDANLPKTLADLDRAAGFNRDVLGARSLWLPSLASVAASDTTR